MTGTPLPRPRPCAARNPGSGVAAAVRIAFTLIAFAIAANEPAHAQRTYGIDEDPVRLGERALAEARLPDARAQFTAALENGYRTARARCGLAQIAVREGRAADAEPLYRVAVAESGRDADDRARAEAGLGLLLLRLGRDLEAEEEFAKAIDANVDCWPAWYGRARLLIAGGQLDPAEKMLARGATQKGVLEGEDLYWDAVARLALARGDASGAEVAALKAFDLDPSDPERATLVGRVYEKRAPTLAIDAFEKALSAPGVTRTAPTLHELGALYRKTGDAERARDLWAEAIAADSTYAPALRDLADLMDRAGRKERAAQIYLRYVQIVPDDVDALVRLARACLDANRPAQALEAANAARRIDPSRADARLAAVRAGLLSPDDDARRAALTDYDTFPPDTKWTAADHSAVANARLRAGDTEGARVEFDRALALDPKDAAANYQAGILALKAGRDPEALSRLETAAREAPEVPAYHLNLGIARLRAGDAAKSVESFRAAVRLNPDLVAARLLLAQGLAASGDLRGAESEYRHTLEKEPTNAQALRGLGFCRLRGADYAGAADTYAAATRAEPGNADAWAGLGLAQLGLEKWDEAAKSFDRAAAIDPGNSTLRRGRELLEQARSGTASG
ncbi:MAG: tetratricopeptide repeat protein [bacterium]